MPTRREVVAALFAQRLAPISVGCLTSAWPVDAAQYTSSVLVWSKIRELGYAGMTAGWRDVEPLFERGPEVSAQLRRMSLRLYGVHVPAAQFDPATGLPPRELITRAAVGAARLGAERIILPGQVAPAAEAKAAELKSIEAECRRHNLRLAYHNHAAELAGANPELPWLIKKTRNVEFLMDWGRAYRAPADMVAFFRKHQNAMSGMYFRDFRGAAQVTLGQGEVDYGPLAEAILKARWSGWVMAAEERADGTKPGEAAAGLARQHLRRLFGV